MNTVFIYTLSCPITGAVRYVGKSNNPRQRFYSHLSRSRGKDHRSNWITSLLSRGEKPTLETEDEVLISEWQAVEAAYIQFFREQGCDLVNTTFGGDSPPSQAGKPKSAEHNAKNSAAHKGRIFSPEHCASISAVMTGKIHSLEQNAKHSVAMMGNQNNLGNKASAETKAKMSAAHRLYWEKRKATDGGN